MAKSIPYMVLVLLLLFCAKQPLGAAHLSLNHASSSQLPPVKPAGQKKSLLKKRMRFQKNKIHQEPNSLRKWGMLSLTVGGYCLFFAIWGLISILGGPIPILFLPFLIFGLILGGYLTIRGVGWIDSSYITYSEHQDFVKDRMRRSMIFDLIFAGLLFLCVFLFFGIGYYTTAIVALIPFVIILFMALLKWGQLRRWKKGLLD